MVGFPGGDRSGARSQRLLSGPAPGAVVACLVVLEAMGNSILSRMRRWRLIASKRGACMETGEHAASRDGIALVLHGSLSYLLQDEGGQFIQRFDFGGTRYPAGPEHST